MHEAAYRDLGLAGWRYQRLPVPPDRFEEIVRALGPAGLSGANVTIPHKGAALALADDASATARSIGAANTLTFDGDAIHADNTDAPGLIDALPVGPRGVSVLVLGAGGSARAAVWALQQAGADDVAIWNRTPERATELAAAFGARAVTVAEGADLLVNCTSVELLPDVDPFDPLPIAIGDLADYPTVVDLAYGDSETALIAAAREAGCAVVDGLEILVRQGALSFTRWTGLEGPLDAMRQAARARS
jgi:shikimate dehydrogenase